MNLAQQLTEVVSKQRKRIVVIGDAMLDHWIHGYITTCQDDCPKLVQDYHLYTPGGAANAHQCLAHWDINSDLFAYAMTDRPIKTRFIDTNSKLVFRWDDESMLVGIDHNNGSRYEWCRERALEMIGCAGGVLLSDYDKGFLTPQFIQEVVAKCKKCGIPCIADAKRSPETYRGAVLKCNASYATKAGFGPPEGNCFSTPRPFIITQGQYAPIIVEAGRSAYRTDTKAELPPVPCINHVGAGDCFAAHLTLALAYGFSLSEAATLAHSAGRVYVQQPHNRPPHPHEIAPDMELAITPAECHANS